MGLRQGGGGGGAGIGGAITLIGGELNLSNSIIQAVSAEGGLGAVPAQGGRTRNGNHGTAGQLGGEGGHTSIPYRMGPLGNPDWIDAPYLVRGELPEGAWSSEFNLSPLFGPDFEPVTTFDHGYIPGGFN